MYRSDEEYSSEINIPNNLFVLHVIAVSVQNWSISVHGQFTIPDNTSEFVSDWKSE